VTGIPSEAKKISALVKRIGPSRVQLNTVVRPPTEEFAFALSSDQMHTLKGIFPGRVDIISENEREGVDVSAFAQAGNVAILALLRRRPCTSADVASGLGIHVTEALKHVDALIKAGKATTVAAGGRTFYAVVEPLQAISDKDIDA
jgi:wyosine [tRNA(Phe)-imidazoG37] synthetase (radical SAM superfamily)